MRSTSTETESSPCVSMLVSGDTTLISGITGVTPTQITGIKTNFLIVRVTESFCSGYSYPLPLRHTHTGIVDGREVSELERQFLQNWKAMRKAQRRRRKRQTRAVMTGLIPPAQQILSTIPPPVPPTMPALPARQPLKTDWRKKQGAEQEEVRLPEIVQTSNSQRPPALSWSPMKGSPQNTWRTATTVDTFV